MSQTIAQRKRLEIQQKLTSLVTEFNYWLQQSEANQPLEKHHSQLRAVIPVLEELQTLIREPLQNADTDEKVLKAGRKAERSVLAIHRIWEYFRSKLVQRREARLQPYLNAADEFAWECYEPVWKVASTRGKLRKEPPLVFFNGGSSPFSVSRDRSFQPEDVPGELVTGPQFQEVLNSLPIPVVGVPWHQVAHLPEALVIGHEVGHTVEDDFMLTEELKTILQGALDAGVTPAHHEAWRSWLGEIFADLYGCLAAGPAFVGSLLDFLAGDPQQVCSQRKLDPEWGRYPTDYLRVLFNLAILAKMGFAQESSTLKTLWQGAYYSHTMSDYEADIDHIVPALLSKKLAGLNNLSVQEVLPFSDDVQRKADATVKQLQDGTKLTSTSVRALFAGGRLAYEQDPVAFFTPNRAGRNPAGRIIERINEVRSKGTRAGERGIGSGDAPTQQKALASELFAKLWRE